MACDVSGGDVPGVGGPRHHPPSGETEEVGVVSVEAVRRAAGAPHP